MRVIAGSAKGRRLKAPDTLDTRPILDRVKTALFDILAPDIVESRFLDLFAGTGQIGIEALSRGATAATFVELSGAIIKLIQENLAITRLAANAEVIRADAFAFLRDAHARSRQFDIVYVAPPQYQQMAARALEQLDRAPLSPPGGLVVVQIHPRERPDIAAVALTRLRLYDERTYGSTLLMFFEQPEDEPTTQQPAQPTTQETVT